MKFVYDKRAGESILSVKEDVYKYLFKVRRFKVKDKIDVRNLTDNFLYSYEIERVDKREAILNLIGKKEEIVKPFKFFHLFWCIVDPKTIERALPMLNEIGVGKITFLYCDRSQKNFRVDLKRLERILINSCMQCGRSSLMELEVKKGIEEIDKDNLIVLDFNRDEVKDINNINKLIVGPEGGFSDREREFFKNLQGFSFQTPLVLKSETACISASSKIIL